MNSIGRVFLAVDLDVNTKAAVAAQLEDVYLPGKPSSLANWHVTLRWIGHLDEVRFDMLLAELDQTDLGPPFRVKVAGFGAFPNPETANVLFRHVGDGEGRLMELADRIEAACENVGLEPNERPYVPHLTLSRLRPPVDVSYLTDTGPEYDTDVSYFDDESETSDASEVPSMEPVRWSIDTITAFTSVFDEPHSRYKVLDTIKLG